jgi:hypothetical protein
VEKETMPLPLQANHFGNHAWSYQSEGSCCVLTVGQGWVDRMPGFNFATGKMLKDVKNI